MAASGRRVILKPPQLDARPAAQLERALTAAVEAQIALAARSVHILQFKGTLQQDDSCFFIEHEAAKPFIQPAALFDPSQSGTDAPTLLRLTAAIFDALRAAHAATSGSLRVHGAVGPGVILTSEDGLEKVSDFGFAQAICMALGPEQYLNLAVAVPEDAADSGTSAIWEVLPEEEYERQDRICAFVDPEKYRTQAFTGFESGSDVIATGFLLHLLAERTHPYALDAEAHRILELSRSLASLRYNNMRRPDLRNSAVPGVKLWCDLLAKMLALPQERPTSTAVCEELSPYVRAPSAAELAARRFVVLQERLRGTPADQIDWQAERAAIMGFAANSPLDAVHAAAAKKLLVECDSRLTLMELRGALAAENLPQARPLAEKLLVMTSAPADVLQWTREADALIKRNSEALREVARLSQMELDADPEAALAQLDMVRNGVRALVARGDLLPGTQAKITTLSDRLDRQEVDARRRIEIKEREEGEKREAERKQRAEDQARAGEWIQSLERALKAQEWDALPTLLAQRPPLKFFPPEMDRGAADIQKQYDVHLADQIRRKAEQERQAAIAADHAQASAWINEIRQSVEAEKWDEAEKQLASKPNINDWPKGVLREEISLRQRISAQRGAEREIAAAREWFQRLRAAVKLAEGDAKKWPAANDVLAERARLTRLPDDIAAELPAIEARIREYLKSIEVDLRRRKEEQRIAQEWLEQANQLKTAEQWDKAIALLSAPPKWDELPDLRKQAEGLLAECRTRQQAAQRRQEEQRRGEVSAAVPGFVAECVTSTLQGLVLPAAINLEAAAVQFTDEKTLAGGSVKIGITVRAGDQTLPKSEWNGELAFTVDAKGIRLREGKESVREALIAHVQKVVAARQQQELTRWTTALRQGVLSGAKCDASISSSQPTKEVSAALALGDGKERVEVPVHLAWREADLRWELKDEMSLARRTAEANARQAASAVRAAMLNQSAVLKRYESLLEISVTAGSVQSLAALQQAAPLQVTAGVRVPSRETAVALPALTATSTTFGTVGTLGDVAGVEAALRKLIVEAQQASRQALHDELLTTAEHAGFKGKAKLTHTPAKITQPVESCSLTISVARKRASLEATWDSPAFTLKRQGDWAGTLAPLFAPPEVVEKKPRESRGFAGPAGIAAALVVAVGLTAWAILGGDRPPPPPTCIGSEEALAAEVKVLLEQSPSLKEAIQKDPTLLPQARAAQTKVTINYQVPGLAKTSKEMIVELSDDNRCILDDGQRESIRAHVNELDILFRVSGSDQEIKDFVSSQECTKLASYLGATITAELTSLSTWSHNSSRWEGTAEVAMHISVNPPTTLPVLKMKVGVLIAGGKDSLKTPRDDEKKLADLLRETVYDIQSTSLMELKNALTGQLDNNKLGLICAITDADGTTGLESPRSNHSLNINCSGSKEFSETMELVWDKTTWQLGDSMKWSELLTYLNTPAVLPVEPPDEVKPPSSIIAGDADFTQWLEALNIEVKKGPPAWLAGLADKTLTKVADPADGEWKLQLPAPWAKETPSNPSDDYLPVIISDSKLVEKQGAANVAARIRSNGITKPDYWPLVERYIALDGGDEEINNQIDALLAPKAVELWKPQEQNPTLKFALQQDVDKSIIPQYDNGKPKSLRLPIQGAWSFAEEKWETRFGPVIIEFNKEISPATAYLTIESDGAIGIKEAGWEGDAALKGKIDDSKERIDWIKRLLPRAVLEDKLALVSKVGPVTRDNAANLLKDVWSVKGTLTQSKDLENAEALINKVRERSKSGGKPGTAFAELFCGPRDCYAIAWSMAASGQIKDEPTVIPLGSLAALGETADRAVRFLDAVLNHVSSAVLAGNAFDDRFRLFVALDRLMLRMDGDDILKAKISSRKKSNLYRGEDTVEVNWSSLEELVEKAEEPPFSTDQNDGLWAISLPRGFRELRQPGVDKGWTIKQFSALPAASP